MSTPLPILGLSPEAWLMPTHRLVKGRVRNLRRLRSHCRHGHAMQGENVMWTTEGPRCRCCHLGVVARYQKRKREASWLPKESR